MSILDENTDAQPYWPDFLGECVRDSPGSGADAGSSDVVQSRAGMVECWRSVQIFETLPGAAESWRRTPVIFFADLVTPVLRRLKRAPPRVICCGAIRNAAILLCRRLDSGEFFVPGACRTGKRSSRRCCRSSCRPPASRRDGAGGVMGLTPFTCGELLLVRVWLWRWTRGAHDRPYASASSISTRRAGRRSKRLFGGMTLVRHRRARSQ